MSVVMTTAFVSIQKSTALSATTFCNGRQRRKLSKTVFPLLGVTHLGAFIYKT